MKTKPTFSELIEFASYNTATDFIDLLEQENVSHEIVDMNIMDYNDGIFTVIVDCGHGQEEFSFDNGVLTTQFDEDSDLTLDLDYDHDFEN